MGKGEETRRRIVAGAAALFNRRGYEGTSLADLMEATGLEKGGIYRHFASKEAIAAAAFDYAWQSASSARLGDLDQISNSVDRLKQFVANFVERIPAVPGGCPMFNTAVDSDDGNPVLRARARKALRGWLRYLASTIEAGIRAGEVRRGTSPKGAAILILSSLEGALIMSNLERDREPLLAVRSRLERWLEAEVRLRRR
jgi:TetR/AcrR family transcriptional regulator, transcriptional repressor for nem operon